ncbi:MAG: helix-turn-helix domain-containing protein, partial [Candidatus Paceibacterota bacterium]
MSDGLDKSSTLKKVETKALTIREAAALSSYTTAHLIRLIKQGKIAAEQINRQWHVDPVSFKNFLEEIDRVKKFQREKVRQERITERYSISNIDSGELEKYKDVSPFNLKALTQSGMVLASIAFFFMLGSGAHTYNYLAILDGFVDDVSEISLLDEPNSSLEATVLSSNIQTLASHIRDYIWCPIKSIFFNESSCSDFSPVEYAIVQEGFNKEKVTTQNNPPLVDQVFHQYVTNVTNPTERETIREVIVREGEVDTSRFVTQSEYDLQLEALLRSTENSSATAADSLSTLTNSLASEVDTATLTVSGNGSIGDSLTVTNNATIGG